MGRIIAADRVTIPGPPQEVFEHLVSHGLPRWLIPPNGRLTAGTPVRIPLTLPVNLGGQTVEILGRVQGIDPGRRIVVHHVLPWQGRIRVSVSSDRPGRSTVSLAVELNDEVVQWAQERMAPVAQASTSTAWRIGLITSASGSASVFSVSARNIATMAVEEINADGGLAGRPLEILVGDDGTHPGLGAAELVRLAHSGCRVVVANVTSEVFAALRPVARRHGVLIIHTPLNEGGPVGSELIRFGERPTVQSAAVIPSLMRITGSSRFFLAGNDYRWPRAAHKAVRREVERQGGTVAAEAYSELGTTDFHSVISSIERSRADLVISTFIGADEVAFEQQMYQAGMRDRVATWALVLDESTHDYIGADASEGLWTAFSYFQGLDTAENQAFKARYRARFGNSAPPVSSMTQCVYDALHLLARATVRVGDWDPQLIGEALRQGVEYLGPRGRIMSSWQGLQQPLYVAQSTKGTLSPVDRILPDSV
ncbi:ABC transporter substrate-binding protein (plasmid) [Rhodococcus pyridinivorans]|uniref:ABC transporter substrate-binding protein n=1 Tax=Rhodococcus pyridinivorans TaxID=103816 RepID=UPI00200B92D6|nr:ABC transporter substrate-binding protein [Rhodococcus pyridinivorans]UPW06931.1 ABC transporter substrate-binding protein [Rhodococcus pyridinivorans]